MAHRVCLQTLNQIVERQVPYRFGSEYVPSIKATREEAPSISSPATITAKGLGREVHTLSSAESAFALFALAHPKLRDLHEQAMLPRWPAPHSLSGMPGVDTSDLPSFRGTTEVANRLGYLDVVPFVTERQKNGTTDPIVFPYIGDLLLFLEDRDGVYCRNWSVKATAGDHVLPGPGVQKPYTPESLRKARARHEIEVETYADVGIRTIAVAKSELDQTLVENLGRILPFLHYKVPLPDATRQYINGLFAQAIDMGEPPKEVVTRLVGRGVCDRYAALSEFYVSIFERRLRVNLFKRVLVDYPVQPEAEDPYVRYRRWFER